MVPVREVPEPVYTAAEWRLRALSPLDGRYGAQMEPYAAAFSEAALIRERFAVEVAWLQYLAGLPEVSELGALSPADKVALQDWLARFGPPEAGQVKRLEARTNHDVKAVEYYLKRRLVEELGWTEARAEFVHFAATSEDINNLAYARMVRSALEEAWLPSAQALVADVRALALQTSELPMLARTHGQPATPTTLGKELAVFVARWQRQLRSVRALEVPGKWGGATGTLAAHVMAYPELDWASTAREFVTSLGFEWAPLTTQVEPHDWLAELFGAMSRFGTVLIDFCRDMWWYVSLGYLRQKAVEGEVGSSAMPHKVNPIDFENAEANAGVAGALFSHLSAKLPVSRLQRDLSDSSALRNLGTVFGYSGLAVLSARRGLARSAPAPETLAADLDGAWEVLAEAVQTVMRRYGQVGGYEQLAALTRGRALTQEEFQRFVRGLDLPAPARDRLLALEPATYTGLAGRLAKLVAGPVAVDRDMKPKDSSKKAEVGR
ncbi:MAG: adenylosuccinate lyase [Actinomycetota bacterium]|nr:adenylosuccinate lyase [Actinomycetota bacterium]